MPIHVYLSLFMIINTEPYHSNRHKSFYCVNLQNFILFLKQSIYIKQSKIEFLYYRTSNTINKIPYLKFYFLFNFYYEFNNKLTIKLN